MKIIFATNNVGKLTELQMFLPENIKLITLNEAGITEDIEEPFFTFRENAWAKAKYVFDKTGLPVFAEDSGIIAEALGDKPGVLSARFAGDHNDQANNAKLLEVMKNEQNRVVYYTAVIACMLAEDKVSYFEGKCYGTLAEEAKGTNGFGYDPLFVPDGYTQSFGELDPSVKKGMSHRSKAVQQLVAYLSSLDK